MRGFTRKGILFFPASIPGWIISAAAAAYCIYLFIVIDSRSHSASDTLINFAFKAFLVFAAYTIIAFLTSRENI